MLLVYVGFLTYLLQYHVIVLAEEITTATISDAPWIDVAMSDSQQLIENLRCENSHENCELWASEGECRNNPNYMRESCRRACQWCENIPLADMRGLLEILLHGARSLYKVHNPPSQKYQDLLRSALRIAQLYHEGNDLPQPALYLTRGAEALRLFSEETLKTLESSPDQIISIPTNDNLSPALVSLEDANFELRNAKSMPLVGFGTWQLTGMVCFDAVKAALAAGYRHFDTAQGYHNEKDVGNALKESDVAREDIFLSTKLSFEKDFGNKNVRAAVMKQLEDLGMSYIDLYMLHSPHHDDRITLETWKELEIMYDEGLIKALGVSNFQLNQLKKLWDSARVKPMYVQNKMSVYHYEGDVLEYCKEHDIILMSYSLINPWPYKISPMSDPWVVLFSRRHNVSPAQILLRWALQMGVGIIPRSKNAERIVLNKELFGFSLNAEEMAVLNSLSHLISSPWNKPLTHDAFDIKDPSWNEPFDDFLSEGQLDERVEQQMDENDPSMKVTIVNGMEHKLDFYWLNHEGKPVPAGEAEIGETTTINTYDGHIFEIHGNGEVVKTLHMKKAEGTIQHFHIKTEL